jgi:hypothetical protein
MVAFIVLVGAGAPADPTIGLISQGIDRPASAGNGGGGGGNPLAGILPLLVVALVVGLIVAAFAGYILFRTRGAKIAPASDEWWTCSNCGAANVEGTARCHACATWRSTAAPRPSPTASR